MKSIIDNGKEFPLFYILDTQAEAVFSVEVEAKGALRLLDANPAWTGLMKKCGESLPGREIAGAGSDKASQLFLRQLERVILENMVFIRCYLGFLFSLAKSGCMRK